MRQTQLGQVVAVTLTREVRPGAYRTEWIHSQHLPTGLSLSPSAVASFLATEHRQIKQSLYRRPVHGR